MPQSKAEWRKRLVAQRKAMPVADVHARSNVIAEKAWDERGLWPTSTKKIAASYQPIHHEVDPGAFNEKLKADGWTLVFPRVIGPELVFETPEKAEVSIHQISLWILPLVGVDRNLRRLGFGGGYYDRVWEKLGSRKDPSKRWSIGLAYGFQWCEFGSEQHDWCLDSVASD
jgi:5-formyltetrahydrofolate cyclo-ligase